MPQEFQQSPKSSTPPPPNTGLGTRQLKAATAYGSQQATAAFGAQSVPAADPNGVMANYHMGWQNTGRCVVGMIMDGTPIANTYRVHVEKGYAPVVATALSHTSSSALGATEINTYVPGTPVIVMMHDKIGVNYILGGIPSVLDVGKRAYHGYVSQASRKRVDELHKKHIKQKDGGQIVNFNAWRAIDSTLASEWGAVTSTGLSVTLDDFMVKMSVNEFCGVYAFYHDQMLRLAGNNLQIWSAGSERESLMDGLECNDTTGYAPYPWEAMGILQIGTEMIQDYETTTYLCPKQKPYYTHWENKHEFQQPYHRTQVFYGYLGQGGRKTVQAPPEGLDRWTYKPQPGSPPGPPFTAAPGNEYPDIKCTGGATKLKNHEERPSFGLHEDNVGLDGRRFIASAKGITLAKRLLIPIPQRLKRPEDPQGDKGDNYKFSSQEGGGPAHDITGDIELTVSPTKEGHLQRAAGVLDLHGYLFNYSGFHPFYWHEKDYKVWEQSELVQTTKTQINHKVPTFKDLQTSMFLEVPAPKEWKIDHRYGQQKYYEAESHISLLEDGGVVIGDGYGGEIRMTGGSVFISAPGDVWLKSGRDAQVWAGGDCHVRARSSINMSATKEHVRIKSEKNVLILAGNSKEKEGGILLESRSNLREYDFDQCGDKVKFGGVVMRAKDSNVAAIGDGVFVGVHEDGKGDIVLDAAKGKKNIVTGSQSVVHMVRQAVFHGFGSGRPNAKPESSNFFSKDASLVCGIFAAEKDIFSEGNVICQENLMAFKGHVLTGLAASNPFVAPASDGPPSANESVSKVTEMVNTEIPEFADQSVTIPKLFYYKDKQIGHKTTHKKMGFSFKADDDYKISEVLVYEDRWQQLAEISGKPKKTWEERPVEAFAGCDETYPYPGKAVFEADTYVKQQLKIAQYKSGGIGDLDRGTAPGLSGPYKNPKYGTANKVPLNGSYVIVGYED